MGNWYQQVEAGLGLVKDGERQRGEDLLRAVAENGGEAAAANLAERLVEFGDASLLPLTKALRERFTSGWIDTTLEAAVGSLADPVGQRDFGGQLAAERQMGNQYHLVHRAIERWKAGDREGATSSLKAIDGRGGDAAVAFLVERLQDLREPRLMTFLEELARRRAGTWVGRRAREAIEALSDRR